jgi:hypothetical protein
MLSAGVDRLIADLMLVRARRRWPLLRFLPRARVRRLILPAATAARQELLRVVVAGGLLAGALLVVTAAV